MVNRELKLFRKQQDERRVQEPVDANCMIDVVADPLGRPKVNKRLHAGANQPAYYTLSDEERPPPLLSAARNVRGCLPRGSRLPGPITRLNVLGDGFAAICHGDMSVTTSIPITFVAGDSLSEGVVESLNHPGVNITGVDLMSGELTGKRLG